MANKKTAKPVQFSIDQRLLKRVDADAETRTAGRSAFICNAILTYLRAKERKELDDHLAAVYQGRAEEMLDEVRPFLPAQAWPAEDDLVEDAAPARRSKKAK